MQKLTDRIKNQFNVSRYKAGRLAHTETTCFNGVANLEVYRDLGIEQVEILETLDRHTCDLCGTLDGKVIPMSQYEPGVAVPPFHPNCRGTTCPHYADMTGERAARNADGEVYYVPADMNYKTWKAAFVDGKAKDGLTKAIVGSIIIGMKEQNVTNEYLKTATPGKGTITYDEGYKIGNHRDEITTAEWLRDTFGGNIHVFNERGYTSVSPDYQWNGKLWELKGPSTATSTDNAVKKALKQIYDNPGGIILNYGEHEITEEILAVVKRRIERSKLASVDVIFLRNGKFGKIFRYKNEGR